MFHTAEKAAGALMMSTYRTESRQRSLNYALQYKSWHAEQLGGPIGAPYASSISGLSPKLSACVG